MPLTPQAKEMILRGLGGEPRPGGTGTMPFDSFRVTLVHRQVHVTFVHEGRDMAFIGSGLPMVDGDSFTVSGLHGHMEVKVE